MTDAPHVPVLLAEVIDALKPHDGGCYVDGTFGAGGYTRALLEAAQCSVIGIDRDPSALARGAALAKSSGERLTLIEGCFGDMAELLSERDITLVDGIALDVGVSSMQIDEAARGFSFMQDGPLDMRMSGKGPSAADAVNQLPERDLADIISVYGEERKARAIARAIVKAREEKPLSRTGELADLVARAAGPAAKASGIHPATRTFQALRIYVNDELGELSRALHAAEHLLKPGGRLAVVSFHSLEDRMVKNFLRARAEAPATSRHALPSATFTPSFALIGRSGVTASDAEVARNPRARSARLRAAERLAAPAHASSSENFLPRATPVAHLSEALP